MTQANESAQQIRGPVPFWFLNGEVTQTDVEREFSLMREKGVTEVIVHPRYGLSTVYLSDDWFELFSWCLNAAKKRGMYLWIYDELNWPSGTAGMTIQHLDPAYMSKYLHIDVTPRPDVDLLIFEAGQFLVAGKYQGGKITKTRQLDTLDQLRALDDNWLVFNCSIKRDQFYVDTLSKHAIDCFKRHTYDQYYRRFGDEFGKTIRAAFTDEPSIYWVSVGYDDWNLPYTEKLFMSFSDRYKYSAVPMLPYLFYPGHATPAFRADFWEHVSNLFNENYHGNLAAWCRRHSLIYTGHNNHEEPLRYQIRYQGNMFGTMRTEGIPGVDHLDKATLGNSWISIIGHKIASSAAHFQRKSRVMSESFGCMNWDTTYLDLKKVVDWQFAQGINLLVPHALFHTISVMTKRESPPSFFYQSPEWEDFDSFTTYVRRLEETLSEGSHACRILVLYPLTGLWSTYQPDRKTQEFEHMDNFLNSLCLELMQSQLDFDLIDSETLRNATLGHGKIAVGDENYDVLLVPSTFYMRQDEYDLIDRISKAGVMTHFFLRQMDTDEANLPEGQSKVMFHATGDLSNFVVRLKQQLDEDVQLRGAGHDDIVLLKRNVSGERICFLVNRSGKRHRLTLRLKDAASACIMRPDDGTKHFLDLKARDSAKEASLRFEPYDSMFLILSAQHELECETAEDDRGEGTHVDLQNLEVQSPFNVASVYHFSYAGNEAQPATKIDVRDNPRFISANWDPTVHNFEEYAGVYEGVLHIDKVPAAVRLVLDKEFESYRVYVNGQRVELTRLLPLDVSPDLPCDKLREKILMDVEDLQANVDGLLKQGENTFRVETWTKLSEPIRLVGDFGVHATESKVRITEDPLQPFKPEKSMPFFSGTLTYTAGFELERRPSRLVLELGDVRDSASVYVNGELVGKRLWAPYTFDVAPFTKDGQNELRVEVRNNLANLLLGQPRPFGLRGDPKLTAY